MNADLLKKANDTSREIAIIEKVLADGQSEFIIGAPTERIGDFDQANISDDPATYEAVKSALTEKLNKLKSDFEKM